MLAAPGVLRRVLDAREARRGGPVRGRRVGRVCAEPARGERLRRGHDTAVGVQASPNSCERASVRRPDIVEYEETTQLMPRVSECQNLCSLPLLLCACSSYSLLQQPPTAPLTPHPSLQKGHPSFSTPKGPPLSS